MVLIIDCNMILLQGGGGKINGITSQFEMQNGLVVICKFGMQSSIQQCILVRITYPCLLIFHVSDIV